VTRNQEIGTFRIPVGATRPAVVAGLNVSFIWLLPIFGLPVVLIIITRNIAWMLAGLAILHAARRLNTNPDLPRLTWLWITSGSCFAARYKRGVEVVPGVRASGDADGVLHG